MLESIITKLDLSEFIAKFNAYLSRPKSLQMQGDIGVLRKYIDELDKISFVPPSEIKNLNEEFLRLSKYGNLRLSEIYEISKMVSYFCYLKKLNLTESKALSMWFDKIIIPQDLLQIAFIFDEKGGIKSGIYSELDSLHYAIKKQNQEIKTQLSRIVNKSQIIPYLVDKQTHLVDSKECLLFKAGFEAVIRGKIIDRTHSGYFFVFPNSLQTLYSKIEELQARFELAIYAIEQNLSKILSKHLLFLQFLNREFDKFDSLQARVCFAKANDYNFISPSHTNGIVLSDFSHPAIQNPKSININFTRQTLIITGVNAGGKTMLLKSILSSAFLAKHLLPFSINPHKSKISHFKQIFAIINDPQNSKNDISTFAGRMIEFKNILNSNDYLLGIDEIELGTDSNEASALFFALISHLQHKNVSIVITTHHKQLASMFASNPKVELLAALYDEQNKMPTYEFLQGTIGKSYAFESAIRYGIPLSIVDKAKEVYGGNLENLSELIEQTSALKARLCEKEKELESLLKKAENKHYELDSALKKQDEAFREKVYKLEKIYNEALGELKMVIKSNDTKQAHRFLNKQKQIFHTKPKITSKTMNFTIGDRVKNGKNLGTIINLKDKMAFVELDNGVRLKIHTNLLKPAKIEATQSATKVSHIHQDSCNVSLDLHGKRVEEALELLDKYISNCLIAGFDEVIIYHGIGGGVLSKVVKDFLSTHPKVKSFDDAPANSGGFGAKVVRL